MYYPRKDDKAIAMKERYDSGLSLEAVATEFNVSRQTVYMMLKRRNWQLRSRTKPLPFVTYNGLRYSIKKQTGYYTATSGKRTLLHRDMWIAERGPIPAGFQVHHRDHDKLHNSIDNFELVSIREHATLHGARPTGAQIAALANGRAIRIARL